MLGEGFLAIWSDVGAADTTDYLHWLTREHTAERLGVAGFIGVRVFRAPAAADADRFLIVYDLETPDALAGQPYLDRLNDPTPWSRRIMPRLRNFARGGGRRVLSRGSGQGGHLAALRLAPGTDIPDAAVARLAGCDRIAMVHLLATDAAKTAIPTNEKSLRAEEQSFAGLLLVEGLDTDAVRAALAACPDVFPAGAALPLFSQVFALNGRRWV